MPCSANRAVVLQRISGGVRQDGSTGPRQEHNGFFHGAFWMCLKVCVCLEHSCALCCLPEVTNQWPSEGWAEEKSGSERK